MEKLTSLIGWISQDKPTPFVPYNEKSSVYIISGRIKHIIKTQSSTPNKNKSMIVLEEEPRRPFWWIHDRTHPFKEGDIVCISFRYFMNDKYCHSWIMEIEQMNEKKDV